MIALLFLVAVESSYFLRMSPGVVSQGLGGASVVVSEGLAAFHNPANVQEQAFNFTLSRWLYATNYLTLGATYEHYSFGFSYLNYGSIQGYDDNGNATEAFTPYNFCIGAGRRFGSFGIALKGFAEKIAQQTQYGLAVCIGFQTRIKNLLLGAKLDNLGKEFSENSIIPYYSALGFEITLARELSLVAEFKYPNAEINSGLQYSYRNLTVLLGGRYLQRFNEASDKIAGDIGLTGGMILKIDNYRIGYAAVYGFLSVAHQFSVTFIP